jgi:hypothetical protein
MPPTRQYVGEFIKIGTPSRITASTAWYRCSTTLSPVNMAGVCNGSGGTSVTRQAKACHPSAGADVSRIRRNQHCACAPAGAYSNPLVQEQIAHLHSLLDGVEQP